MTYPPHRFGRLGLAFARLFGGRVHKGVRVRGMLRCRPGGPLFIGLGVLSTLVAGVIVLAGLLAARLSQGPITIEMLKAPMAAALEQRVGNGYKFDIGDVLIEKGTHGFGLIIQSLSVKDAKGRVLLAAPKALVGIDMLALMVGEVKPTRLDLAGLEVRVAVDAKGAITLAAGTDSAKPLLLPMAAGPAAPAAKSGAAAGAPLHGLATAIAATVDLATYEKSPLGAMVHVGIADGRLVIDDRTAGRTTVFSNFDLGFEREAPGQAKLTVAADGPNGRWSANVEASETDQHGRLLEVRFKDLSLAEFMLAGGLRKLPIATVMPVSGHATVEVGGDGTLRGASGDVSLGAGILYVDDPDQLPFHIDEVAGRFTLDPATGRIAIDKMQYFAQKTQVQLSGAIDVPATAEAPWRLTLAGDTSIVPARPADPSIKAKVEVAAAWEPFANKVSVSKLRLAGADIDAVLSADLRAEQAGPHLKLRIGADRPTPVGHIGSLWPTYIQPRLRTWILDHVRSGSLDGGVLTFDCDANCFVEHAEKHPLPPDSLDIDATLSSVELTGMEKVPRLSGIAGKAKVAARSARFTGSTADIAGGDDSKLSLTDWTFDLPDTVPAAMRASASARLEGSIASLREFVRTSSFSKSFALPPELATARGRIDARMGVDFTINGEDVPPSFRANARVTNFSIDKVVGDEKLENCTMNVSFDDAGVHAKGDGRIFGAPATLEVKKPAEGPGEATLQATLDDAFRARRGLSLGTKLTGPVVVRASTPLGREKAKAQIEADFTRAKIDNLLPGWIKAAGKPAKATLTIAKRQDFVALEQIALDGGNATIRGSAELSSGGALIAAKLTQLRIGGGDDMKVDVARAGEGLRVTIRAGAIDVRPLLRSLAVNGNGTAAKSPMGDMLDGKPLDLDLKAVTVTGQNQRVMKNVDLKLARKGSSITQLRFSAKLGHGTLAARLDPGATPLLTITAGDAGAVLAFFDFYGHMEAGRLEASIQMGADDSQAGSASIDQFVLRDEPAISRVSAQAQQEGAAGSINLNPALVRFTRFQTVFNRGGGRVALRDTVMWGNEIGATVEGSVDFARDYVNLHGTFVPAYALNNMFSKIPFFGPILGGGSNEGLFAVNYRVSGAASSPTVSINLLSAVAPGFLRQIFGAIDGTGGGATGSYHAPDTNAYAPSSRPLAFPNTEN